MHAKSTLYTAHIPLYHTAKSKTDLEHKLQDPLFMIHKYELDVFSASPTTLHIAINMRLGSNCRSSMILTIRLDVKALSLEA